MTVQELISTLQNSEASLATHKVKVWGVSAVLIDCEITIEDDNGEEVVVIQPTE